MLDVLLVNLSYSSSYFWLAILLHFVEFRKLTFLEFTNLITLYDVSNHISWGESCPEEDISRLDWKQEGRICESGMVFDHHLLNIT